MPVVSGKATNKKSFQYNGLGFTEISNQMKNTEERRMTRRIENKKK